jgi:AsmA family
VVAHIQDRAVKVLFSRRGAAMVAALVLVLFWWRPGMYRFRSRIANSIGSALGRRVTLDNVHLRILPRPGFDLDGLVIYDDPAYSAEPMIRAEEVSAAIRFRSLLRGRLEIATLSATEPSINLVRNIKGHWNLASLLERNAQIPVAPTGKTASEHRPAFPYLEASNARINFKIEQTKKSYALMDADVALWQDSDNSWSARIKAEPVRTDFHLTDTGLLQISATWLRAVSLSTTPVQLTVRWQKGQLGQITKLLSGKDRGWRGGVDFTAKLSGTPEALRIESQTVVEDFHRYDIVEPERMRLAGSCSGKYNAVISTMTDLLCEAPISDGAFRLRGTFSTATQVPTYDLSLAAEKVPLASATRLLRQAKKRLPNDLTATGLLNGEFHIARNGASVAEDARLGPVWTGNGAATDVRLSSTKHNSVTDEVGFGTIPFSLVSRTRPRTRILEQEQEPAGAHLRIGPVMLAMNSSVPMNAGGWVSAAGYRFFLRGDVELKDLFRLEDMLGLPVTRPAAEGSGKLDMSVHGPWQGFAPAMTTGTAQLRDVRAEIRGLNTPIEISSATLTLSPEVAALQKISARIENTHWTGSVTSPRHCTAPNFTLNSATGADSSALPVCVFQFDLTADQFSSGDLVDWFTPHSTKRPWYRILNSNSNNPSGLSPLLALQAHGSLHVGRFALKKMIATQIATQVEVDRGKIMLTFLRGQLLQGSHQGNWMIDLSPKSLSLHDGSTNDPSTNDSSINDSSDGDASESSAPTLRFHGTGTVHDIALTQIGMLMNDAWITGTGDGSFDLTGYGNNVREIVARSDGKLQFAMRSGSLPHIEIPGSAGTLLVHRFTGELQLKKGRWELSEGKLESRDSTYKVRGTATPNAGLNTGFDFVLTRGDERSWTLTGTLAKPHVEPNVASDSHTDAEQTDSDARAVKP